MNLENKKDKITNTGNWDYITIAIIGIGIFIYFLKNYLI